MHSSTTNQVWAVWRPRCCTRVLTDNATTARTIAFGFGLAMTSTLSRLPLDVAFSLTNAGDGLLPALLGGHMESNWLLLRICKSAYQLTFADGESAPVCRLREGLLLATPSLRPCKAEGWRSPKSCWMATPCSWAGPQATPAFAMPPSAVRQSRMSWQGLKELASDPDSAARLSLHRTLGVELGARLSACREARSQIPLE